MSAAGRIKGQAIKRTMLAAHDLERLGCNPMTEIFEAMEYAKMMTKKGGNYSDDGRTDQANWAALWLKSAETLASYKHPKLSAVAIHEIGENKNTRQPLSTQEALKILQNDPMAPQAIKAIDTDRVVEAMSSQIKAPFLPMGGKDE